MKHKFLPRQKEPKKIEFDLKGEESKSTEEHELEEEEPHTLVLRRSFWERRYLDRYNASNLCPKFDLSIIDDDPRIFREEMDSRDGKL